MKKLTPHRGLVGGAVAACLVTASIATAVATPSATALPSGELPLGPATLDETRSERQVAPGVTHVAIERGRTSADDFWTVTIGVGTTEEEAAKLEQQARDAGYEPRRDVTAGPDPKGPSDQPLGWMVRVGKYRDKDAAQRLADEVKAKGMTPRVQNSGEDGHETEGPWSVDVMVIDPATFRGRLGSELGTEIVPGRETTSSVAKRTGALAAINGGYFVIDNGKNAPGNWLTGTDGDLAGVSVVNGELVSEAVTDRPALVVPTDSGRGASVKRLRTKLSVRANDGASREITGLNRQAGLIVNCGGVGDATPFSHAAHDYTCGNLNELIAVTPKFGDSAPEGSGFQATLDENGRVAEVQGSRGGSVPQKGTVLQATGTSAEWLRAHAKVGAPLTVRSAVVDSETRAPLPLSPQTSIINGGPLLLRDGEIVLDPVRDGWSPEDIEGSDRANFYNGWYLRRNPRTAAGITEDGRIILLTADGRRPGHSVGLTIDETAKVMRSLGAVDAINLDGGGSTAMVVNNELQGIPSENSGERPDGDALVVLPEAARKE
ncbi:phosphodiester glycosidase family protein [Streptomyces cupreus]|uniref:Phosphodiester glycosidase family protein n=1 Tax=Streptomyces cupreus TaxID=2759956 RepID=A0A7X1J912_9ACTN|nr:phosphodiester glycosidase family protein [Streptomyces cupreus]MBC2906446.1 phosphodiester glycosidase family protein [Streptomyces cupreus]